CLSQRSRGLFGARAAFRRRPGAKPVSAAMAPQPNGASPRQSWTDLGPRFISALVLIALTVFGLWFGGYVFAALVGAVFAGCYREWERMVTLKPLTTVGGVLIALVAVSALVYPLWGVPASLGVIVVACVLAAVL